MRDRKRAKGKGKASSPILEVKFNEKTRVTSAEVSAILIHPSLEKDLVIVGDRAGNLGFWFPSDNGDDGEVTLKQKSKSIKSKWSWLVHRKNEYQEEVRKKEIEKEQRRENRNELLQPESISSHGQYMEAVGRRGVPISCLKFRPGSECNLVSPDPKRISQNRYSPYNLRSLVVLELLERINH